MKPFEGTKVYYAGSIRGADESDKELPWKIVRYMADNGADVLSEHVAARTPEERESIRAKHVGQKILDAYKGQDPDVVIRKIDLDWVDQADCVVALVNAPSLGVGMELEHAILKPKLGLNETPVLALVHKNFRNQLSAMVSGVTEEYFYLKIYENIEDIQKYIDEFMIKVREEMNKMTNKRYEKEWKSR